MKFHKIKKTSLRKSPFGNWGKNSLLWYVFDITTSKYKKLDHSFLKKTIKMCFNCVNFNRAFCLKLPQQQQISFFPLDKLKLPRKPCYTYFNGVISRFSSYLELQVPPHDCPLLLCPPLLPRHPAGGVQPIEGRGGQDLTGEGS